MTASIAVCVICLAFVIWLVRRDRFSFGLPAAYVFSLLLIHVPGALAHIVAGDFLPFTEYTQLGIYYTAIGVVSFAAGLVLARTRTPPPPDTWFRPVDKRFPLFCLAGGWLFTYGLSRLGQIPTLGAVVAFGGAIWMLGVILGLRSAMRRADAIAFLLWLAALLVYPVLMLLLGGFLSYGTTAMIVVLCGLIPLARSHLRVAIICIAGTVLGFNVFINYFQHRDNIRDAVWGGAPLRDRVDVSTRVLTDFEWFDPSNDAQLIALDSRLNQNFFVGLAATRIADHEVDYLAGRSVWEGVLALVPRALWPDKPVFGGSPKIVSDMTGLILSEETSWGVGNVMEFQINFGVAGVIGGFLLLGFGLGYFDRKAAFAAARGDLGTAILFFLPAVALIQPNGSIVEMVGGSGAALAAAYGWRWAWREWSGRRLDSRGTRPGFSRGAF